MSFFNNFKQIFNKQYFDFEAPDIGLSTFHPQIRIILAINGLFSNNKDSKLRFIWPMLCIGLSLFATTLEYMTIYHALKEKDAAMFTESFAYSVIIGVVPFLYLCVFKNGAKMLAVFECLDRDFKSICAIGNPYKAAFLQGQLRIWQCGFSWMVFVIFVAMSYILLSVVTVLYYCLFVTRDEEWKRPLIFPARLPLGADPHETPVYEIFLLLMYLIIVDFVTTFTAYVYLVFHLLLHCYYLLDMVILGLERLFEHIDENVSKLDIDDQRYIDANTTIRARLKRIVTWHNGVFNLVSDTLNVYGTVLAYQVIFSSMVICLMAFYISAQLEQGNVDICISLLSVGALLQLWIPCYIGSLLRIKGALVADAAFYCGWHRAKLAKMALIELQLIIIRSQRPITIQMAPLPVLQLETFSSIMSTAYSYFNMLQQSGN